ncbi:SMI1/KNR4 family protein [Alkalicoccobacillus murimartini]|uniref:SMI1/KNR4 family protein n=1 Tax=Alkalicoccobacillus murimartini TaxID=171685 RepID=A0ABT9YH09_9BACI|nr:SMI1/KNR4 family protein [Alkalicoccobacillus murimartini]MDQ0206981.1 hypothetical protein [Alkalicoccobacillus murimartini]
MNFDDQSIVKPLPSVEVVKQEEEYWNAKLPLSLKNILIKANGAIPLEKEFSTEQSSYVIERFLCIVEDTDTDNGVLDIDVTRTRLDERIIFDEDVAGAQLLPFAVLFAGDYLCLNYYENEEEPKVYVWKHEESSDMEPYIEFVADNLNEFLKKVQ